MHVGLPKAALAARANSCAIWGQQTWRARQLAPPPRLSPRSADCNSSPSHKLKIKLPTATHIGVQKNFHESGKCSVLQDVFPSQPSGTSCQRRKLLPALHTQTIVQAPRFASNTFDGTSSKCSLSMQASLMPRLSWFQAVTVPLKLLLNSLRDAAIGGFTKVGDALLLRSCKLIYELFAIKLKAAYARFVLARRYLAFY